MKTKSFVTLFAASLLVALPAPNDGSARAQGSAEANWYVTPGSAVAWTVRTKGTATCPALSLHLVRNEGSVVGVAATGDQLAISRVAGTADGKGGFHLTVTPVEVSGPKGTIDGNVDFAKRRIDSRLTGFGCSDGILRIPYTEPVTTSTGG